MFRSGKSTLLKALAGQVKGTSTGIRISADELTYNGVSPENFCLERTVAYIGQRDEHYAELTVQETLDFSARVQGTRRFARTLWSDFFRFFLSFYLLPNVRYPFTNSTQLLWMNHWPGTPP